MDIHIRVLYLDIYLHSIHCPREVSVSHFFFSIVHQHASFRFPPPASPYVCFWSAFFRDFRIGAPLRFLILFFRVRSRDGRRGGGSVSVSR